MTTVACLLTCFLLYVKEYRQIYHWQKWNKYNIDRWDLSFSTIGKMCRTIRIIFTQTRSSSPPFPTYIRPLSPPYFSHTSCHSLLLTTSTSNLAFFLLLSTVFLLVFLVSFISSLYLLFIMKCWMLDFAGSKLICRFENFTFTEPHSYFLQFLSVLLKYYKYFALPYSHVVKNTLKIGYFTRDIKSIKPVCNCLIFNMCGHS